MIWFRVQSVDHEGVIVVNMEHVLYYYDRVGYGVGTEKMAPMTTLVMRDGAELDVMPPCSDKLDQAIMNGGVLVRA